MGLLRMLRIRMFSLLSNKTILLALALLVCLGLYRYVSLQKDDLEHSISPRHRTSPGQSGVLRFQPILPIQQPDNSREQKLIDNGTLLSNPLDISRVAEYCNIPKGVVLGEEGEVPAGYTLAAAYMVIRHGDRTPVHTLLDVPQPQPREGCVMNRASLKRMPELQRFMYDMAVFKDKQPTYSHFFNWALSPQHKNCSSAQLTGRGALQHLYNGMALKEKYVKKWNLFGSQFSPATQLKLHSTQYSRTYQSAVAFLYAFLPQFNISELDIQASEDTVFCHGKYIPKTCCNALARLKAAVDKMTNNRGQKNPYFESAVGALAEVFETKISRLPYTTHIIDALQGHACHSLHLPCGKSGRCVSASMMKNLWTLADTDGESLTKDERFDIYSRISMRSLLLEIVANMGEVANNLTALKFSLYSGHDFTISPLLQALGMYDGKWPRYAARVVFELYRANGVKGENYIRILYNGRDVTSLSRLCRDGFNDDGLCRLKDYLRALTKDVDGVTAGQSLLSFCRSWTH